MHTQKILVTGSSGFIGTHLLHHLEELGYQVFGLDLKTPDDRFIKVHHSCDLMDRVAVIRTLQTVQPDAVVHLAARTDLNGATDGDYPVNSIGVANLAEAIRQTSSVKRCLFTSSQLVCRVGYLPAHDEDYCPPNPYGASKVHTEQEVRSHDGGGAIWCLLRPTTIWGSGMNAHYASFFRHLKKGHYFHPGNKDLYKSYGYVGNTVHQIERFLSAPPESIHRKVFYLADYEPLSLPRWINAIAVAIGKQPPPSIPLWICRALAAIGDGIGQVGLEKLFPLNSFRLNNILAEYVYDMSRTREICGELPWTMTDGIRDLTAWIEGQPSS
ncbi:MAG: NAD(P)-dependent oxidoreductase [Acidobacteria bacterium]|nr:NAD(P)-dependent oxidoreductase [Acidobacteriota bacterium]